MPCRDVVESTVARLCGEIPGELEADLDAHLATCERCRAEALKVESAWGQLDDEPGPQPSPAFVRDTLAKMEEATLARRVWTLRPATVRAFRAPSFRALRPFLAQAAALTLAAGAGYLAARGGTSIAPVLVRVPGSAPTPAALALVSQRTLDVSETLPDLSGRPRLGNVAFTSPDERGRIGVAFDVTTRYTVLGKPGEKGIGDVLTYLLANAAGTEGTRGKAIDLVSQNYGENAPASPEIVEVLAKTLKTDRNPGVRKKAAEALGQLPASPAVRDALLYALRKDTNPAIRVSAVEGLARIAKELKDKATIDTLRERANDETENGYLRGRAASALRLAAL